MAILVAASSLAIAGEAQVTYPVNVRMGVHTESAKRNTSLADAVTARTSSSIQVFEATVSPAEGGIGIGARLLKGAFGDTDLSLKEGLLFLGPQWLQVEGTYGQRSQSGTDSMVTFARAGLRSIVRIGGSGVSLSFSGSKYFPAKLSKSKPAAGQVSADPEGWEGETSVFYTAPKVPVFLRLGYRTEYFSFRNRDENIHGIILGAGLWLGGR